jgi:hypothetical protein
MSTRYALAYRNAERTGAFANRVAWGVRVNGTIPWSADAVRSYVQRNRAPYAPQVPPSAYQYPPKMNNGRR